MGEVGKAVGFGLGMIVGELEGVTVGGSDGFTVGVIVVGTTEGR